MESARILITNSNNDSVAYCGVLKNRELRIFSKFLRIEVVSPSANEETLFTKLAYELIDPSTRSVSPFCGHIKERFSRFWPCKTRFRAPNYSETDCILSTEICDDISQCPGGEDEDFNVCSAWNSSNFQLSPNENGESAAPMSKVSCPKETFYCHDDAKCIVPTSVCDGTQDCFGYADESSFACEWKKNQSDFLENKTSNLNASFTPCSEEFPFLCPIDYSCLPTPSVCNGIIDCSDGFDEGPLACKISGNSDRKLATGQPQNLIPISERYTETYSSNEIENSTITTVESTLIEYSTYQSDIVGSTIQSSQVTQGITNTVETSNLAEAVANMTCEPLVINMDTLKELDRPPGSSTQGTTHTPVRLSSNGSDYWNLISQTLKDEPIESSNNVITEYTARTGTLAADEDVFIGTTDEATRVASTEYKTSEFPIASQKVSELITSEMENLEELASNESVSTTKVFETSTISSSLDELLQTSPEIKMTPESAANTTVEFPNVTTDFESLNPKKFILVRMPNEEGEIAFPPLWIAHVSSGSFFLCYGILLAGESSSRWVLIPAACGRHLKPSSMRIHFGAGIDNYEIIARMDQINQIYKTGFSLLQLNSSENIKYFIPQGINLTSPFTTETNCRLLAPKHGYIYSFQLQDVYPEDSEVCAQRYGRESNGQEFCYSQSLCLQNGLGGILTCSNSTLGFYIEGADCYQGQIGWPVVVSKVTNNVLHWIRFTTGVATDTCGYAHNEEKLSFPWYTYFNRTRNSGGLCLAAYVQNDTFPLVTSVLCLRQCMRSMPSKVVGDDKLENGCKVESGDSTKKLCPAKNITLRLSVSKSPWKKCLVAYLDSLDQKNVQFEHVKVSAFKECAGERFYNPFMTDQSLCISAIDESELLNCSLWGEAGLVQCQRRSDELWEFVGFTQTCPPRKPIRRWFMRSMEL